jgi:hypothetical protein
MTIQQNIFGTGNPVTGDNDSHVKPQEYKPDSQYLELICRIAKRYGFSLEEMQKTTNSYACLPKHCLAYFLYLDLGLTTYKVAEWIYGSAKSHANISWISAKMAKTFKTKSQYRFCYDDVKIVWKEIEEKYFEEKDRQKEDYTELMNILNN